MKQIDASRYEDLAAAVDSMSSDELVATIRSQDGGVDEFLDQVFAGMGGAFLPERAGNQEAVVQYDVGTPDGTRSYTMRVAGGRCEIGRGAADNPKATLSSGLADFLRLLTGKLNPMQALMTGKIRAKGDLFFLQTMQGWFQRPGA